MLIALLVILGVDLLVVAGLVAAMLVRRRWLGRHGAFKCRIRLVEGTVEGAGKKWRRGQARWVRDILVFSRAPLLLASWLLPVDSVDSGPRPATGGEGKGLGGGVAVGRLATAEGAIEFAVPDPSDLVPVVGPATRTVSITRSTGT